VVIYLKWIRWSIARDKRARANREKRMGRKEMPGTHQCVGWCWTKTGKLLEPRNKTRKSERQKPALPPLHLKIRGRKITSGPTTVLRWTSDQSREKKDIKARELMGKK